jgi:hypothetical protein
VCVVVVVGAWFCKNFTFFKKERKKEKREEKQKKDRHIKRNN